MVGGLEFTGGVKNATDTRYFSRTDDRNAGILVGRQRTFYLSVECILLRYIPYEYCASAYSNSIQDTCQRP